MSSFLSQVTTGVEQDGQRIVLAGPEGIGKTTLACSAPNALLVPMERGYATMPVAKTPQITTLTDLWALMDELEAGSKTGRIAKGSSIVFDSASTLERLIHQHVLRTDKDYKANNPTGLTMEQALGGYGKAYNFANEQFGKFTDRCDLLSKFGKINIILTCHVFSRKVLDPAHGEYHSWDLLLHSPKDDKNYGKREMCMQWADMVGFMHEPMFVMKGEEGEKLRKAVSSNQGRVMAVSRTPAWAAKNRFGLGGVIPIPKDPNRPIDPASWNAIANAVYEGTHHSVDIWNRTQ